MNARPRGVVKFKKFSGVFATWDRLFQDASDFASALGPDRLISISHSADNSDGVVVVWYWSSAPSN